MGEVRNVTVQETQKLLEDEDAVLIDVREPAEHRGQKIPVSKNIPLSKIDEECLSEFVEKGQKILVHCKGGKRSQEACAKLAKSLKGEVYNVQGGIDGWANAGFAIEKSKGGVLPLDRQVQLVISLMILTGLALYYFGASLGLVLPLIAGLGLMNAAVTGWCGMAKLIALMPWNR